MFFNLGRYFMQPSQLDGLLQQPDCTLERIFDADNILQEIKGLGSQKFADYITRHPELYRRMVNYIILIDDEVLRDKKRQIQYPFMSSEIMGTENTKLIDFLFERSDELDDEGEKVRESLLPTLISFLDQDCLNVTSAGYFAKAFIPIIKRRGYDLWARINEEPQIISNLIKHLDIKHIAEIVEKLILIESQQETQFTFMELRQRLLERIIIFMNQKSHCREIVDNVSDILCEITSKSMSNIFYNNNEIIPFIDIIKKPELLFSIALKSQSPSTFQVLINLVELMSKEQNRQEDDEVIQEKDYSSFYKLIYELPGVLVQKDIYIQDFENSNKQVIQPFGLGKIKLLKLIHALIQTNDENICKVLADNKLFTYLQTITIRYPGNNQIQSYFDKIVRTIIESNHEQVIQAIVDSNLLGFIATYNTPQNAGQEYIGFLTRLSNYLLDSGKLFIKDGFNSKFIYIKKDEKWKRYLEVLKKINEKEKPFLCGIDPKKKPEELDAEEDVTVDQGVLEILRKFNPYKPPVEEKQEQPEGEIIDEEITDEEITEKKQEERDLESHVKQIEQENADFNFNLKNYWQLPINEGFAEQVLNSYD